MIRKLVVSSVTGLVGSFVIWRIYWDWYLKREVQQLLDVFARFDHDFPDSKTLVSDHFEVRLRASSWALGSRLEVTIQEKGAFDGHVSRFHNSRIEVHARKIGSSTLGVIASSNINFNGTARLTINSQANPVNLIKLQLR